MSALGESFTVPKQVRRSIASGFGQMIRIVAESAKTWYLQLMKTTVNLDDEIIEKAVRLTGISKRVDLINLALRELVRQREIEEILTLPGKINWEGDLETMREDRVDPH